MSRYLPPKLHRFAVKTKTALFRRLRYLTLRPENWKQFLRLSSSPPNTFEFPLKDIKKYKIACILDEFSYESFKFEADFVQLDAQTWRQDIEKIQPDFLLVESAWKGKNGKWFKKVSEISNEIIELTTWADKNSIPAIFWHKEVPPHFKTFMNVSRLFDAVFLTDGDCIDPYKKEVGHQNVFFLPFACQPAMHHPVVEGQRKNAMIYAGTFYPEHKYPDRYRNFIDLYNGLEPEIEIDIFDRSSGKGNYTFPEQYHSHIKGSLPFSEMSKMYRNYDYGLNMNSVKESATMCSRRVFELIACNTIVVGNDSKAVKNYFGNLTIASDSKEQVVQEFKRINHDPMLRDKTRLLALRKVMSEHTYQHRLKQMIHDMGGKTPGSEQSVLIIGNKQSQNYPNTNWIAANESPERLKSEISRHDYVAWMQLTSVYGPDYITDLVLAFKYADSDVVTKESFYQHADKLSLQHPAHEYKYIDHFNPYRSIVTSQVALDILKPDMPISIHRRALSIDRFNFCQLSEFSVETSTDLVQHETFV